MSNMPFMTKYLLNRMIGATKIFSESITERRIVCGISGENHLETLIYQENILDCFSKWQENMCSTMPVVDSCVLLSSWDCLLILDS